jgi:hypothetical protein
MASRRSRVVPSSSNNNSMPFFGELQRGVIELVNIQPPQAGGDVIISMPVGRDTYEKVIVSNNIDEDKIKNIKILINGQAVWEFADATEMRDLQNRYNEVLHPATGEDSAMTFNFERLHLNTLQERKALGLGTLNIQKLAISFKLDSSVENPLIEAFAFVGKGTELGLIRIIRTVPYNSAVAGQLTIINPFSVNKTNNARVLAVHFLRDDISKVEVVRGAVVSHKYTKAINNYHLATAGRKTDDKAFFVDFCNQNTLSGSLTYGDTANDFITLKPTVPSAGACNMLVEYVGTVGSV